MSKNTSGDMASQEAVAEIKLAEAHKAAKVAASCLVEALEALGYQVAAWREDWSQDELRRYWDDKQEAVAKHVDNGTLWGELHGREDWDAAIMLSDELDADEVKNVCSEKGIALAENDDLRPIAVAAVRVVYAGMHDLFDRLADLKMELKDRGLNGAEVGEMILRG